MRNFYQQHKAASMSASLRSSLSKNRRFAALAEMPTSDNAEDWIAYIWQRSIER